MALTQMISECCDAALSLGKSVSRLRWTRKLSGPALSTALGDLWWSMVFLSRGLLHSNSLDMSLTSTLFIYNVYIS